MQVFFITKISQLVVGMAIIAKAFYLSSAANDETVAFSADLIRKHK
jgi:hypothetical protein